MCLNQRRGSKQALPCRHHLLCFRVTSKRKARTEISVGKTAGEAGIRGPFCDLSASLDPFLPRGPPCFPLVGILPSPQAVSFSFFFVLLKMDGKQVLNLIFRIHNGGCTPSSRNLDHGVGQSLPTARNRAFQTADLTPLRTELLLKQCLSTAIAI